MLSNGRHAGLLLYECQFRRGLFTFAKMTSPAQKYTLTNFNISTTKKARRFLYKSCFLGA